MNPDYKENYTPSTSFSRIVAFHTIKFECMETIKQELKDFANNNCYHIIDHTLNKVDNEYVLTIQYI